MYKLYISTYNWNDEKVKKSVVACEKIRWQARKVREFL
jgi:hypothetical protein